MRLWKVFICPINSQWMKWLNKAWDWKLKRVRLFDCFMIIRRVKKRMIILIERKMHGFTFLVDYITIFRSLKMVLRELKRFCRKMILKKNVTCADYKMDAQFHAPNKIVTKNFTVNVVEEWIYILNINVNTRIIRDIVLNIFHLSFWA